MTSTYATLVDWNHVYELVREANESKNIHETIDEFKRMAKKSKSKVRCRDYKEACLLLGVDPEEF